MGEALARALLAAWRWASALWWPILAAVAALHPRLRVGARSRLGFPEVWVDPGALWVHAASVGEGRAAAALIAALREARPERAILRTWTSATAADQDVGADASLALPADVAPAVAAWLARVRPAALILVEAELWPVLLAACRARGIPVVVVQARVAAGLARVRAVPGLWAALTAGVRFLAADAATAALVGGEALGDLKREATSGAPALRWRRPAVVAGSTHPGEEAAIVRAVAARSPRPLLVLAPRDPRRFDAVWAELAGERAARRSALPSGAEVPDDVDVVLLDSVGELGALYAGAAVAVGGGTWTAAVGGHSPAEADAAGAVLVRGPFVASNAGAWAGVEAEVAPDLVALGPALERAWARAAAGRGHRPRVGEGTVGRRVVERLGAVLDAPAPPEAPLRPWLAPGAWVWGAAVALRPEAPRRAGLPVISVGALTAGGSGKTPVSAWLAGALSPGPVVVVARGYGRDPGGEVRGADPEEARRAERVGDELAMLARRGLAVRSCPDRLAALADWTGGGVAILDDGFAHRRVARDLEVVVIDARWPTGGGLLPVGLARVPPRWLGRADVVWVNHGPLPEALRRWVRPDAVVVEARFRPVGWLHRGERLPLDALSPRPALLVAGIARPAAFLGSLRALGWRQVECLARPDHHRFAPGELDALLARAVGRPLLLTEKDAARLPPDAPVWALCVAAEVRSGEGALRGRLARLGAPGHVEARGPA